jgi:glyoxylase-like metal-dependent hydrolase (beta-lactamase superfamily II)
VAVTERAEPVAENVWRWTTPHPLWREGDDERPGGWPRDVGSVLHQRDGVVTIVDPLAGEDDPALWAFLDERCAAADAVVVALTAPWHRRSSAAVAERYGAEVRVHRAGAARAGLGRPFDGPTATIAPGVEALVVAGNEDGEVAYWLAGPAALVTAEVLQGTPEGLRYAESPDLRSRAALLVWLRNLESLDVRLVLPAHGPPAADRAAIRRALALPPRGASP